MGMSSTFIAWDNFLESIVPENTKFGMHIIFPPFDIKCQQILEVLPENGLNGLNCLKMHVIFIFLSDGLKQFIMFEKSA